MNLQSQFGSSDDAVWDSDLYRNLCSFVPENGRELVEWLNPREGERILDLGCGTGELSVQIARSGADVTGIDASAEMISTAREEYPGIEFIECDALSYRTEDPFDAVFSNAVLHWIREQDRLLKTVTDALKPQGRFVGEFGARGNIHNIRRELHRALSDFGHDPESLDPWYFPTANDYAHKLHDAGFTVRQMTTVQYDATLNGDEGIRLWLTLFGQWALSELPESDRETFVDRVIRRLRDDCYENGQWHLDYRRLRFRADKP